MPRQKLNVLRFDYKIAGRKRMHKIRGKDLFEHGGLCKFASHSCRANEQKEMKRKCFAISDGLIS